jgi:hypothetical protein
MDREKALKILLALLLEPHVFRTPGALTSPINPLHVYL